MIHALSKQIFSRFHHFRYVGHNLGRLEVLSAVAEVSILCVVLVVVVRAAGFSASFETESAVMTGAATITTNTGASGNRYLAFGSGTAVTPILTPAPVPIVAPTPAPTLPSLTGYPDGTNTGVPAGTVLKTSGSLNITVSGAIISGLLVTGTVTVSADNVTIKNTRIMNTGSVPIRNYGTNLIVMDSEIDGRGKGNPAVAYNKYTLLRVNIHDVAEGPRIAGGNVTIQDSYFHHMVQVGTNHTDVIQAVGGSNIILRHNTLLAYNPDSGIKGNASFMYGEDDGALRTCLVEDNYMNGGNYTVNGGGSGTTTAQCTFYNNKFGRDHRYGIKSNIGPGSVWAVTNGYLQ